METAPLILTLQIDEAAQTFFDNLRRLHFPPAINYLSAHLTLFHHLPGEHQQLIESILQRTCDGIKRFELDVSDIMPLGRGVAYRISSPSLRQLHQVLQGQFTDWLTPQDRQSLRPHITIQNKVHPDMAKALLNTLKASFEPFKTHAEGLQLWHYRNGPWEAATSFHLNG